MAVIKKHTGRPKSAASAIRQSTLMGPPDAGTVVPLMGPPDADSVTPAMGPPDANGTTEPIQITPEEATGP
jgi:hypothetical protein